MTNEEDDIEEVEAITVEAIIVEPEIEPEAEVEAEDVDESEPEAEAEEPSASPPAALRTPKAPSKQAKGSKMKVVIVVVVLVVAVVALAIIFMGKPTLNSITVHAVGQKDGLKIIVDLSTSGFGEITDDATLEIIYEDTQAYKDTIKITGNGANLDIPYEDFLVGNGDYDIFVNYNGMTGADIVNIPKKVVENVSVYLDPSNDPETEGFQKSPGNTFNLTFFLYDKSGKEPISFEQTFKLKVTVVHLYDLSRPALLDRESYHGSGELTMWDVLCRAE